MSALGQAAGEWLERGGILTVSSISCRQEKLKGAVVVPKEILSSNLYGFQKHRSDDCPCPNP